MTARLLTRRQFEVAQCVAEDLSTSEIAYELGITESSVKGHLSECYARLGVQTRVGLALAVKEFGPALMQPFTVHYTAQFSIVGTTRTEVERVANAGWQEALQAALDAAFGDAP